MFELPILLLLDESFLGPDGNVFWNLLDEPELAGPDGLEEVSGGLDALAGALGRVVEAIPC